ncbi:GlxA family transcriptional regulator [Taklimakanibacter deserti]|uniref:GlxA family transcriptional regulator n=1 Tax=Taklimakanibacter deserti TaxID=2267839 RepID=UPI000E64E8AD
MAKRAKAVKPAASAKTGNKVIDVTIVLVEGGYASTAIGPLEVFHSAGVLWNWLHGETPQPQFKVTVASVDGGSVTSLCSLGLVPEMAIDDIKHTDVVIVPASGWDLRDRVAQETRLLPWLRKWHSRGAYIAGICTGVYFLAEAGLLDGRQATTHWGVADILRQRYPKVHWRTEQFVTEDGRLLCSGGVYASIDLSLYLVEKFCGHEVALHCAKSLLVSMPRGRQSGYAVLPLSRPHSDDKIRAAEEYLRGHFDDDVSIDALAQRIGMSARNFIRRFKAATGSLPGAYVQMLRMSAARELLERGAGSIQTVCAKTGYADIAFFRSLFKRHTGMTPAEYRRRFAQMNVDRGELAGGGPA